MNVIKRLTPQQSPILIRSSSGPFAVKPTRSFLSQKLMKLNDYWIFGPISTIFYGLFNKFITLTGDIVGQRPAGRRDETALIVMPLSTCLWQIFL